jgi:hypothetical protein
VPGKVRPTRRNGCSEAPFCEGRPGHSAPRGQPRLNLRMLFGLVCVGQKEALGRSSVTPRRLSLPGGHLRFAPRFAHPCPRVPVALPPMIWLFPQYSLLGHTVVSRVKSRLSTTEGRRDPHFGPLGQKPPKTGSLGTPFLALSSGLLHPWRGLAVLIIASSRSIESHLGHCAVTIGAAASAAV